jgi:sulfide:quinone oxidoreductase
MKLHELTPALSVSAQLTREDVQAVSAKGFRAIINNRPDDEASDQPTAAEIETAAKEQGLAYRHIPVVPGQVSEEQVVRFVRALAEIDGPILAFCRSGTRSATLWALSQAGKRDSDAILTTAAAAGYDLTPLGPRLAARAETIGGTTPDAREQHDAA